MAVPMSYKMFVLVALVLAACTPKDSDVRVTAQRAAVKTAVPTAIARSEPVFYNGKTYRVHMTPQAGGTFDMAVDGMVAVQQKDAVAVATSSVRYFACPDGKTGILLNNPKYVEGSWQMSARCS